MKESGKKLCFCVSIIPGRLGSPSRRQTGRAGVPAASRLDSKWSSDLSLVVSCVSRLLICHRLEMGGMDILMKCMDIPPVFPARNTTVSNRRLQANAEASAACSPPLRLPTRNPHHLAPSLRAAKQAVKWRGSAPRRSAPVALPVLRRRMPVHPAESAGEVELVGKTHLLTDLLDGQMCGVQQLHSPLHPQVV